MKRGLAGLLSIILVFSSGIQTLADTRQAAAENSAAFPVSYDSRDAVSFGKKITVRPGDWAELAADLKPDGSYAGDAVSFPRPEAAGSVSFTAAQKVFILSRTADITEAVWFSMNDGSTSLGTPDMRIRESLLDGAQVFLGDDYEIIGWDDEALNTGETKPDPEPAQISETVEAQSPSEVSVAGEPEITGPDETPDTVGDGQEEEDDELTILVSAPETAAEDPLEEAAAEHRDAAEGETPEHENAADEPSSEGESAVSGSIPESPAANEPDDPASPETEDEPTTPAGVTESDEPTLPAGATESDEPALPAGVTESDEPAVPAGASEPVERQTDDIPDTSDAFSDAARGAWLVKNLADDTVEYLAYETPSAAACEVLCLKTADQEETRYSYRTDGGIGDGRIKAVHEEDPVEIKSGPWAAQVFTALHDENLTEISFYTDALNTAYDLIIYTKKAANKASSAEEEIPRTETEGFFDNPGDLVEAFGGTLSGKVSGCGLHTVVLPEPVPLTEGMLFGAALRFRDDRTALFYDSTETAYDESGREIWTSTASSEPKTQFISSDTMAWLETEPAGERAWRIGAVTDYDPASPVMRETGSPLTDGAVYIIRSASNKNYVLDAKGGGVAIRTNIQLHKDNSTVAQKWFASANSDGTWSFVSYMAGRALDVEGNNGASKVNVQLHTPRFHDSQKWTIVDAGGGTYNLRHADSGLVLDVAGGTMSNGSNIQIYRSNGSNAQKFIFEKVSERDFSGEYVLTMSSYAATAVGVAGASADENANIEAQTRTMAASQIFTLTRVSGSYYKVINKNSGKALTINSRAAAGMNVKQASYTGSDLQLWRVVYNGDGTYTFFSKALNNICLDVAGGKTAPGTNVRANGCAKSAHQRFVLRDPNKGELDGTYVVRSALYPDRVLDVAGGSADAGANIQSYNNNWTIAQQFVFKKANPASAEPLYYITNKSSGKMLAYSGTLASDANVIQDTASNTAARQWKVTANSDGTYTISPAQNTALALDIASASIAYKANIRVHRSNSTAAQKWYLSSQRINTCSLTTANNVQVTGSAGTETGDDNKIYLFALNPTNYIVGSTSPIGSCAAGQSFTLTSSALNMEYYINYEYFTGIKLNGKYYLTSNGMYITNPERASTRSTARTTPLNKKGMALSSYSDAFINEAINTLHIKHTAMNIPLAAFINGNNAAFTYRGTTRSYVNMEGYKVIVRKLNAAGVQVTGVIYADAWLGTSGFADYITPTGRNASAAGATLAGMNASEKAGREKLEAAFAYMATEFSTSDCHIDNWVIGNELDNPVNWNYCGDSLALDHYVTLYTQVYRLAYNAMKRVWGNVRVYDSLDSVWNVSRGTRYYTAKAFQDSFNSILSGEGAINWGMAYHPYCAPELDPRIWAYPQYATRDPKTTQRITLDNIGILATYVSSTYGSGHPIILSETGINYSYKGVAYPGEQAAAIAYGYYNVEAAGGIDNLIIHNENGGEWTLGLYNDINSLSKRPSFEVFANMDGQKGAATYTTVNKYGGRTLLQIVGAGKGIANISRWTEVVPGLNMSKFLDPRY